MSSIVSELLDSAGEEAESHFHWPRSRRSQCQKRKLEPGVSNPVEEAESCLEIVHAYQASLIHQRCKERRGCNIRGDTARHDDSRPPARPRQPREQLGEKGIGVDIATAG